MPTVVTLRPSALETACKEAMEKTPTTFIIVTMQGDTIAVWGPPLFDMVTMLGMMEYAKMKIEEQNK